MTFRSLHQQEQPLLLGNVWDVPSARIFEKLNYQAIGTSSAAIAHMLGYADGEQLSFEERAYIVKRIKAATTLPLTVDIESGYSRDLAVILQHLEQLYRLGVVGINIEDSIITTNREITDANSFKGIIAAIKDYLLESGVDVFINVRTDPFLLGMPNALEETLKRLAVYEKAGADGIFVPGIEKATDIATVVSATALPVNVMYMPKLPNFEELKNLGVKRISMGSFLHQSVYRQLEQQALAITQQQSFTAMNR